MTEDEAKTKWCPFSRVIAASEEGAFLNTPNHQSPYNRMDLLGKTDGAFLHKATARIASARIASACMAWRTETEILIAYDDNGEMTGSTTRAVQGNGFCGLAGPLP